MKILGIDLGTTNSAAALYHTGRGEMIANVEGDGERTIPSLVSLRPGNAEAIVGQAAHAFGTANPQFTFTGLKRLIGRRFDDPYVQGILDSVPFDIVEGVDGMAVVQGPSRVHAPEDLLALVLKKLKQFAQIQYQDTIAHAVIAVPAYFDELQKAAVRRAAAMAGLEVLRTIPEPTAAALAYGLQRAGDRNILVYDFGGGTFDVSILSVRGQRFKTLAQAGDAKLGGINFDMAIAAHMAEMFQQQHGVDPRGDIFALHRLMIAAEQIKKQLSGVTEIEYRIDRFLKLPSHDVPSFEVMLNRRDVEVLVDELVERSFDPVRQALADARLEPTEIDEVVLVGGQTRMPLIQRRVREFFGREALRDINPDEAVAMGAAIHAATISGDISTIALNDIATITIGVEVADGTLLPIIKRREPLARRRTKTVPLSAAGQAAAAVRIYQGERIAAAENRHLTTLVLEDLSPQGVEVALNYDAHGVLQVEARDLGGGATVSSGVHLATGLSAEQAAIVSSLGDDEKGMAA